MSIVDSSGSSGHAGVMAAIVLAAGGGELFLKGVLGVAASRRVSKLLVATMPVASLVLFLKEARKLLQKILSSKGEHYA